MSDPSTQVPPQQHSTRDQVEETIRFAQDGEQHDVVQVLRWAMAHERLAGPRPETSVLRPGATDERWDALSAMYQCAADVLAAKQSGLFNVGEMELASRESEMELLLKVTDAGRAFSEVRISWHVGDRELTVAESYTDRVDSLDDDRGDTLDG